MNQAWIRYLPIFIRQRVQDRHNLQQIIGNTGWLISDKILRMGVGLLVGVWIARYLGPEQFGLLNYAAAFVVMFSSIATLGLDGIVVRDIVQEPSRRAEILGTVFILKIAGGIFVLLITVLLIVLMRPHEKLTQCLVAITAIGTIFQAFDTIDFWFQARVQSKYTVYAKNFAYVIIAVVKICLIVINAPLIAFAWAGLAETILGAAGLIVVYQMQGQLIKEWVSNLHIAKRLLKDSWPLVFSGTFVLVNMLIDKIMLGGIASNVEVGLYSAAARLSELWYFIPMMVGASVMPTLVRERSDNELNYYSKLQQTYNLMTISALFIALPTTILSPVIVKIIYGAGYASAAHMLSVHIWTALFVFHVSIRTRALMIESKQQFIAVISFCTMVMNVIFNWFLIPLYGGVGASYASLFSWMLSALLVPYLDKDTSESVSMFIRSFYVWLPLRR